MIKGILEASQVLTLYSTDHRRAKILEEAMNVDIIPPYKRTPTPPNADQNPHVDIIGTSVTPQKNVWL